MTSGPDDALATHELDLVTRASKGDTEAFDRFYEKNAPGVQLLVERLLGPGTVADTVVVEAFEKTVRRLPLLGARNSSPRLYALTTARNGAYAALGRERPEPTDPAVAALLSLPSRQRELLALRELGLSEAECAEVAGIEQPEVGVQVARARLRLTDALESATLSAVFAEPRAERLLAAAVVRQDGTTLAPEVEEETTTLADSDARFAAALSAVRSPSRSVGQLPPASGASRLAPIARDRATSAAGAGAGAGPAAGAFGAAASAAAPAPPPAPAPPKRTSDPYNDDIGDEAAWGIVDDDDGELPPPPPAPPADGPDPQTTPGKEPWDSGTPAAPPQPPAGSPGEPTHPPHADDPLAGWDDALDWDEDDRTWTAGTAGTAAAASAAAAAASEASPGTPADADDPMAGAPIAGAPQPEGRGPVPTDPGATRPFDVVGAGLADPDDEAAITRVAPGPPAGFDFGGGDVDLPEGDDDDDGDDGRRSPWRFLLWLVGFALLFAGVAFAAYTYQQEKDSPDAPPSSTLEPTTRTTSDDAGATSKTTPKSSSSKSTPKPKATSTPKASSSSGSSSSGSSGASSSSGSSSSSSSSGSSGSSSGSSKSTSSSGGATTGGSGGATSGSSGATVSGGESTSGGSVRGGTDATTP